MSDTEQPFARPKSTNHGKIKDLKKRDFLLKELKKQREEEYLAQQRRQEEEEEEAALQEISPPPVIPTAQKIVIVRDSYLDRDLSHFNRNRNDQLPRKWSKRQAQQEEDQDDDDEDEDDEDGETGVVQKDGQDKGIYDLTESEDDQEEDEVESALSKKLKGLDLSKVDVNKFPTHEESSDEEEDYQYTKKRVVQIIEDFNEIEVFETDTTTRHRGNSQDYADAKTTAPKAMRDKSKSPRLISAGAPKSDPGPAPMDLSADTAYAKGGKSPYHGSKLLDKKEKDLIQQMEDLDLGTISSNAKKPLSELAPLPHPDELDHGVWWKYILDHGAKIANNGRLQIDVVHNFPPAHADIPEEYFHFPPGRKSAPEKPLTAFGLFKQHKIQEHAAEYMKSSNHCKKSKSKHHADDTKLKAEFYALDDEELQDYYRLALAEKIRYKVQRTEFIYQQSTQLSLEKGRAHKERHYH